LPQALNLFERSQLGVEWWLLLTVEVLAQSLGSGNCLISGSMRHRARALHLQGPVTAEDSNPAALFKTEALFSSDDLQQGKASRCKGGRTGSQEARVKLVKKTGETGGKLVKRAGEGNRSRLRKTGSERVVGLTKNNNKNSNRKRVKSSTES